MTIQTTNNKRQHTFALIITVLTAIIIVGGAIQIFSAL